MISSPLIEFHISYTHELEQSSYKNGLQNRLGFCVVGLSPNSGWVLIRISLKLISKWRYFNQEKPMLIMQPKDSSQQRNISLKSGPNPTLPSPSRFTGKVLLKYFLILFLWPYLLSQHKWDIASWRLQNNIGFSLESSGASVSHQEHRFGVVGYKFQHHRLG